MSDLRASSTPAPSQAIASTPLLWRETVVPGGYTHKRIARGTRIRLDDPTGEACATVFLVNAVAPWERLSVADTQKIPNQAYLREGLPCCPGTHGSSRPWWRTPRGTTTCSAVPRRM
jgi:uncharacterized protein YcgI (DUF1989 family)